MAWPILLLITAGTSQAAYFALMRKLVEFGASPLGCIFWQAVIGALFFGIISYRSTASPKFSWPYSKSHILMAISFLFLPNLVVFLISDQLPLALVTIIACLSPICTYVLVLILKMEKRSTLRIVGILLGFIGTIMLMLPQAKFGTETNLHWLLLSFLLPLSFASSNILRQRFWPADQSAASLSCGMMVMGAVLLLPTTLATNTFFWPTNLPNTASYYLIAYLFLTTLYVYLSFLIIKLAGAVFISQIGYVVALAGIIIGAVFFNEDPSIVTIIAGCVVVLGVVLVSRGKSRV